MRNHVIAIQGSAASFHDLAAKKYFGEDVTSLECGTFREVCDKISNNKVDYGIIAIENRVAGSILLNYQLIQQYDLRVIGEVYLPIELQLLAKQGVQLKDVKEIVSHPMALGQSQQFLAELDSVIVTEYKDTATSAKIVVDGKNNTMAVIAGPAVGKKYGLEVLVDNVCDVKLNYTRFYILSKGDDYVTNPDKASVMLQTYNKPGMLSDALNIIKKNVLNLTKIQSVPIPEEDNIYAFHLDIEFDDADLFAKTIKELELTTKLVKVLGKYKKQQPEMGTNGKLKLHKSLN
jgi:prephenate dehydratase